MKKKNFLLHISACISWNLASQLFFPFFRYLLAADTKSDRATWIDSLNEALRDGRAWKINEKSPLYPDLSRMHNQDVYMCSKQNQH